jgi:hypothetical protein
LSFILVCGFLFFAFDIQLSNFGGNERQREKRDSKRATQSTMGCVHSCGVSIEESGEERDSSNDGKRLEKNRATPTTKKESNKTKSSEKGNKSWYLDSKEEPSFLKANKSKDVAKDTNSKASPFIANFSLKSIK